MKLTSTREWLLGSMAMLLIQRSGNRPPVGPSTSVQVGDAAVPLLVRQSSPSLWPAQMTSALPSATCAVEWLQNGLSWKCALPGPPNVGHVRPALICVQVGG